LGIRGKDGNLLRLAPGGEIAQLPPRLVRSQAIAACGEVVRRESSDKLFIRLSHGSGGMASAISESVHENF
jgi:hypothetical protein